MWNSYPGEILFKGTAYHVIDLVQFHNQCNMKSLLSETTNALSFCEIDVFRKTPKQGENYTKWRPVSNWSENSQGEIIS